jgi:hypothetical protein
VLFFHKPDIQSRIKGQARARMQGKACGKQVPGLHTPHIPLTFARKAYFCCALDILQVLLLV